MDIDTLRTFVVVVRRGSFAAVARELDVAPSSVSRVVAALEAELGVGLFHRTTRRLSLTEAGRAYADRAGPVLEELERAGEVARDLGAAPRGLLRVAVAGTFARLHVALVEERRERQQPRQREGHRRRQPRARDGGEGAPHRDSAGAHQIWAHR